MLLCVCVCIHTLWCHAFDGFANQKHIIHHTHTRAPMSTNNKSTQPYDCNMSSWNDLFLLFQCIVLVVFSSFSSTLFSFYCKLLFFFLVLLACIVLLWLGFVQLSIVLWNITCHCMFYNVRAHGQPIFKRRERDKRIYLHTYITYEQISKWEKEMEREERGGGRDIDWFSAVFECNTVLLLSWRNSEMYVCQHVCVSLLIAQCLQPYNFLSCIRIVCVFTYMHVLWIAAAKAKSIFRDHYIWFDLTWFDRFVSKQHQLSK